MALVDKGIMVNIHLCMALTSILVEEAGSKRNNVYEAVISALKKNIRAWYSDSKGCSVLNRVVGESLTQSDI